MPEHFTGIQFHSKQHPGIRLQRQPLSNVCQIFKNERHLFIIFSTIKMYSVMSEARATFLQKSRLIFQTKTIVLLCLNHKATPLIRPTPNLKNEMISEISRKNLAEWCIEL